jgi:deoxyribonuclease V
MKKENVSPGKLHETQLRLSDQIIFDDMLPEKIQSVAGVDAAYTADTSIAAASVLDYESLNLTESRTASCKIPFPYVPTLLFLREAPSIMRAIRKLKKLPDVFLVDGHGYAHPYRCGLACYVGLAIKKPTIGVAKSRLFGEAKSADARNEIAFLKYDDEVIGAEVKTKVGCKPVYVSVGHMISLGTAIEIVRHCARNSRIPEPILEAHHTATTEKRKINIASGTNE